MLLPEPIRSKAIDAVLAEEGDLHKMQKSMFDAINGFYWLRSPDGLMYWGDINKKMGDGEISWTPPKKGDKYVCVEPHSWAKDNGPEEGDGGGGWSMGKIITVKSYDEDTQIVWPKGDLSGIYLYGLQRKENALADKGVGVNLVIILNLRKI